jgi:hypothetical protein
MPADVVGEDVVVLEVRSGPAEAEVREAPSCGVGNIGDPMMGKTEQILVRPPRPVRPASGNETAATLRAKLDGYTEGREMGRRVERQRSDLIAAMEQILAAGDIEIAHEIARQSIDGCAILQAAGRDATGD